MLTDNPGMTSKSKAQASARCPRAGCVGSMVQSLDGHRRCHLCGRGFWPGKWLGYDAALADQEMLNDTRRMPKLIDNGQS